MLEIVDPESIVHRLCLKSPAICCSNTWRTRQSSAQHFRSHVANLPPKTLRVNAFLANFSKLSVSNHKQPISKTIFTINKTGIKTPVSFS